MKNLNSPVRPNHDSAIDLLRIFAALGVVMIHSSGYYTFKEVPVNISWWTGNIFDSFSRWCVPVFVMISGALLIKTNTYSNPGIFFSKRVRRILIPLIFWTAFFIVFNIFRTNFFSVNDIIASIYYGIPYYHLWYLYMIVGIYCVTPAISLVYDYFPEKQRMYIITGLFIIGAIDSFWIRYFGQSNQFFMFKFLPYLGYFMMGKEVVSTKIPFNKYLYLLVWLFASITIVLLSGILRYINFNVITLFNYYLNPLVIIQSISLFVFVTMYMADIQVSESKQKLLIQLSELSFGIYVIHPVFIEFGRTFKENLFKENLFFMIPVFSIAVFTASGIVTILLKKVPYLKRTV